MPVSMRVALKVSRSTMAAQSRGKPVHRVCEDNARAMDQTRAARSKAEKAERAATVGAQSKSRQIADVGG